MSKYIYEVYDMAYIKLFIASFFCLLFIAEFLFLNSWYLSYHPLEKAHQWSFPISWRRAAPNRSPILGCHMLPIGRSPCGCPVRTSCSSLQTTHPTSCHVGTCSPGGGDGGRSFIVMIWNSGGIMENIKHSLSWIH